MNKFLIFKGLILSNVRFLKNVISQSISKYSISNNNVNVKSCLKLNRPQQKIRAAFGPPNYMYLIELYEIFLDWSVAFEVFKI